MTVMCVCVCVCVYACVCVYRRSKDGDRKASTDVVTSGPRPLSSVPPQDDPRTVERDLRRDPQLPPAAVFYLLRRNGPHAATGIAATDAVFEPNNRKGKGRPRTARFTIPEVTVDWQEPWCCSANATIRCPR